MMAAVSRLMPQRILLALFLLVFAATGAWAQAAGDASGQGGADAAASEPSSSEPSTSVPGTVVVTLSPEEITVGGRVRAEVTVVWMGEAPKEPVRFPTWQDTWGDAEILERSQVEAFEDQSGRHVARQVIELTSFETGEVQLPSRTLVVPLADRTVELESQPVRFAVTSVLPAEEETAGAQAAPGPAAPGQAVPGQAPPGQVPSDADSTAEIEPRGAAPPADLGARPWPFYLTTFLLLLVLTAGLEALRRALARERSAEGAEAAELDVYSTLAPLEELLARLEQVDANHGGAAHTGLSLALRRFLGRRLGFNAVESTTTEIQRRLLRGVRPQPPGEMVQQALELLRAADLVKFAGLAADPSTVRLRLDQTRELGRSLDAYVERMLRPLEAESEERAA